MFAISTDYLRQFETQGMRLGTHVLSGLLVFLVFLLIARAVRKVIAAAVARMSTQGRVDHIVAQLAYVSILVIGVVAALSAGFGVDVTALVASLGLAGFAVGFAVKDILSNSLAGVLILVQRPFTIGDEISLAGAEGRVIAVRVRDTLIKTGEETLTYVPNSIIFNCIVTNKSAYGVRLVTCRFKCAATADAGEIMNICSSLLSDHAEILKATQPQVTLNELSGDGLGFQVKFWIDPRKSNADAVRSAVLKSINDALSKKGINLQNADEVATTDE